MQRNIRKAKASIGKTPVLRYLTNRFIPTKLLHSRTNRGLAQVFVLTHMVGFVAALLMVVHLATAMGAADVGVCVLATTALIFAGLPFVLKHTGNFSLVGFISFQTLAVASLVGTYQYGGFASPFLPWLLVSLMAGLFYLSKRPGVVLGLFALDVTIFFGILLWQPQPDLVRADDLRLLSWISIAVAMTYMAIMALYYAKVTANRAELQLEADRYRGASAELEQARLVGERLNRSRSLFFSKMSHELRTPLNAIIGYSEILLEDFEDQASPDPQQMADLRRINSTGKHLLSLVADVLDVDTLENDALRVEVARFSLGQLCDDIAATAAPLVEKNGNKLVVNCPLRDDIVKTDEKKLRQMLINLLSNAGKFTNDGTVTLEVWIERGAADDRLHATVGDTGIGIAPDVLPHLFETYMQADASIQSRFGGTGIGLALTRKFAVLLGGEVTATSNVGEGSCFAIDIPAELKTDADQGEDPLNFAQADGRRDSGNSVAA